MLTIKNMKWLILIFIPYISILLLLPVPGLSAEDRKGIHFGADLDYFPLSELEDNCAIGFDVDLVSEIGKITKRDTSITLGSWASVLNQLETGMIDAVTGILFTEDRKGYFDFTIPYIQDSYMVFTYRYSGIHSAENLAGQRGVILSKDAIIESFLKPHGLSNYMKYTSTFSEALQMVADKKADFTIAPYLLGRHLIKQNNLYNVIDVGRSLTDIKYRIAVRKGEEDLLYLLNNALYKLNNEGTLRKLHYRWRVHYAFENPPSTTIVHWMVLSGAVITGALILFTITFFIFRKLLHRATSRIQQQNTFLKFLLDSLPFKLTWKDLAGNFLGEKVSNGPTEYSEQEHSVMQTGHSHVFIDESGQNRVSIYPVSDKEGEVVGTVTCLEKYQEESNLRETIQKLISELSLTRHKVEELEMIDSVTGLYNSQFILNRIEEEITAYARYESGFCLLLLDFSDSNGNTTRSGLISLNKKIIDISSQIRHNLSGHNIASHIDGERFLILLPRIALPEAEIAARTIIASVTQPCIFYTTAMYQGEGLHNMLLRLGGSVGGE